MIQELESFFSLGIGRLRQADVPEVMVGAFEQLQVGLRNPCVVAVVGRAKAGKSTFVNALLGGDYATTGGEETTATINLFRHPRDQERLTPVINCHDLDGKVEEVSRDFVESLQGHRPEALQRAEEIAYLEFILPHPYLAQVTLVDTPGTEAAVAEHAARTEAFLRLRRRHDQETRRLGAEADAVVYLVGYLADAAAQELLDEFRLAAGGHARPSRALGVMAKIDVDPRGLEQREALARQVDGQLQDRLNTVVPVSAGLHLALEQLLANDRAELRAVIAAIRRIPGPTLDFLLDSDQFFFHEEPPDCPILAADRRHHFAGMPWGVVVAIARVAADPTRSEDAVVARLRELSGFDHLRDVLERRFVRRGRFLRCDRIAQDAKRLLDEIKYRHLLPSRDAIQRDTARRDRFLAFIRAASGPNADLSVASDLESFVRQHLVPGRGDLHRVVEDLERELGRLLAALDDYSSDYEALQDLEDHRDLFTQEEIEELRALFGLYGYETDRRLPPGKRTLEHIATRQPNWSDVVLLDRRASRVRVAEAAVRRYGLILEELDASASSVT
jgi:hypothetical protein